MLAVALVALIAFAQSYGAWLHPIIDAGRDLYIPEQLRGGARLYTDILYFYPPVAPYVLAAITAVTGSSLGAYVAIGAAIALLTALALWSLVHRTAGAAAAVAVLLLFFSMNMVSPGGFGNNYFFPYAHAATIGMLLFLGGVACLERGWRMEGLALLLAASWTKIEFAVFGAVIVAFLALVRRIYISHVLGYLAAAGASLLLLFNNDAMRANVLPPSLLGGASAKHFYGEVSGTAYFWSNLGYSFGCALLLACAVLLLRKVEKEGHVAVGIVLVAAAGWVLDQMFFRAWTVLQLVLLPFAARRPREPLALLLLVSLLGTSRIFLNLTPSWYGFVYTLPLYALIAYVLFEWLPSLGVYSRRASYAWLALCAVLAVRALWFANATYEQRTFAVTTQRGTYYDHPERGRIVASLLQEIKGARSLVVLPEGLAINYLANVSTPLTYTTFTPVELDPAAEQRALAELIAKRPEKIAIVTRDVREFGKRGFGVDYGKAITQWVTANYRIEKEWRGKAFSALLFTTRSGTSRPDSPSPRTPAPTQR